MDKRTSCSGTSHQTTNLMLRTHEVQIRVRYQETDGQGRLHHANYFTYFELGRTELLAPRAIAIERLKMPDYCSW